MNSLLKPLTDADASVIHQIPNFLLIIAVIAIYQSGLEAGYTLGMMLLTVGVIAKITSLVVTRTNVLIVLEQITVIGMFIGILWMLQAWNIKLYEYGFVLLGICTLAFIIIIHIPTQDTD